MITAEMIARLRQMTGESSPSPSYTDERITAIITDTAYDLANAVYDMHAAAAQVWEEKWATLSATVFDFTADDRSITKSQLVDHAREQLQYHRSRRRVRSARMILVGVESDPDS